MSWNVGDIVTLISGNSKSRWQVVGPQDQNGEYEVDHWGPTQGWRGYQTRDPLGLQTVRLCTSAERPPSDSSLLNGKASNPPLPGHAPKTNNVGWNVGDIVILITPGSSARADMRWQVIGPPNFNGDYSVDIWLGKSWHGYAVLDPLNPVHVRLCSSTERPPTDSPTLQGGVSNPPLAGWKVGDFLKDIKYPSNDRWQVIGPKDANGSYLLDHWLGGTHRWENYAFRDPCPPHLMTLCSPSECPPSHSPLYNKTQAVAPTCWAVGNVVMLANSKDQGRWQILGPVSSASYLTDYWNGKSWRGTARPDSLNPGIVRLCLPNELPPTNSPLLKGLGGTFKSPTPTVPVINTNLGFNAVLGQALEADLKKKPAGMVNKCVLCSQPLSASLDCYYGPKDKRVFVKAPPGKTFYDGERQGNYLAAQMCSNCRPRGV